MANEEAEGGWDAEHDYSDEASTFGDRVTAARMARNMSQPQLARRLGIRTETLANWENDRAEPRANKLQMLAGVLNVSIIWLMSGVGEAPTPDAGDGPSPGRGVEALVQELREIRALQGDLATRLGRLEKRLRILGEDT